LAKDIGAFLRKGSEIPVTGKLSSNEAIITYPSHSAWRGDRPITKLSG
jgi:hypothetical protein